MIYHKRKKSEMPCKNLFPHTPVVFKFRLLQQSKRFKGGRCLFPAAEFKSFKVNNRFVQSIKEATCLGPFRDLFTCSLPFSFAASF